MRSRSEEHTSELQSHSDLVCRLLLEKKKREVRCTSGVGLDEPLRLAHQCRRVAELCGDGCVLLLLHDRRRAVLPCFFFNDTATTEIYTLSLHDALPISIVPSAVGMKHAAPTPSTSRAMTM